ncbi:hypothetical protein CBL_20347 [Carabus blaptoides fortunei]
MADRGFLINDSVSRLGGKLIIPAFTKGKNQLEAMDLENSRNIAHVRIHVERVIGLLRNKFKILQGLKPMSMSFILHPSFFILKGHLISMHPVPQHLHVIITSGDAPSCGAKRKKKEETKKGIHKLPKLDSFFKQSTAESIPPVPSSNLLLNLEAEDDTESEQVPEDAEVETKSPEQVVENIDLNHNEISMQGNVYLSDKFNFPDPLTNENKRFIIENGPCQPMGPFQKN